MASLRVRPSARKPLARTRSVSPVLSHLRKLYAAPEWALLTEVRSKIGPGTADDVLRVADALAVRLWGGEWRFVGFEAKASRADWLKELDEPEKSAPLKLFCGSWYLVVAAPWKRVVLSTRELPDAWGLIEVGTGGASVVVRAGERHAEPPEPSFLRALIRAATRDQVDDFEQGVALASRVAITRPGLSRHHVGLACGHVAPRPFDKVLPTTTLCFGCAEGRPADRDLVRAILEESSAEELDAFADIFEARRAPGRRAA